MTCLKEIVITSKTATKELVMMIGLMKMMMIIAMVIIKSMITMRIK